MKIKLWWDHNKAKQHKNNRHQIRTQQQGRESGIKTVKWDAVWNKKQTKVIVTARVAHLTLGSVTWGRVTCNCWR